MVSRKASIFSLLREISLHLPLENTACGTIRHSGESPPLCPTVLPEFFHKPKSFGWTKRAGYSKVWETV
jgi:hypothetical protein